MNNANLAKSTIPFLILAAMQLAPALSRAEEGAASRSKLVAALAQLSLQCAHQPYEVRQGGEKSYGAVRSHCEALRIEGNQARFAILGDVYTVEARESENADAGDLNDLYLVPGSGREVLLQDTILAFGDPIVALLTVAGESPEQLPLLPAN